MRQQLQMFSENSNQQFPDDNAIIYGNGDASVSVISSEKVLYDYLNDFFPDYPHRYNAKSGWNLVAKKGEPNLHDKNLLASCTRTIIEFQLGESAEKIYVDNSIIVVRPDCTKSYICLDYNNRLLIIYNYELVLLFNDLYRTVRQLLAYQLLTKYISFHGSGFAFDNQIYSFIGEKGAGKTTYNTALLSKYHLDYFCNDKFFLSVDNRVVHWPECPALTFHMINLFPNLVDRVEEISKFHFSFAPDKVFINHPALPSAQEIKGKAQEQSKIYLTNAQYVKLLNVNQIAEGVFNSFILLRNGRHLKCSIREIDSPGSAICLDHISNSAEFPNWISFDQNVKATTPTHKFRTFEFIRTMNLDVDIKYLYDWLIKNFNGRNEDQ